MANPTITIPLDPQTAQAYNSVLVKDKRKMQALLANLVEANSVLFSRFSMRPDARRGTRGLTPEMLESLAEGRIVRNVLDTNVLVSAFAHASFQAASSS
jgi:hypothetical protein